jgi:hypothetical protein
MAGDAKKVQKQVKSGIAKMFKKYPVSLQKNS